MTSRCTQGGLVSGFGASTAWSQTAQAVVSELGHGLCRADGMSQVGEVGGCGGYKTTRAREYTHTHTQSLWRALGTSQDPRERAPPSPFALSGIPPFPGIAHLFSHIPISHSLRTHSASAVSQASRTSHRLRNEEICGGGFSFLAHPTSGTTNPRPPTPKPFNLETFNTSVHSWKNGFPAQSFWKVVGSGAECCPESSSPLTMPLPWLALPTTAIILWTQKALLSVARCGLYS